MYTKDYFELPVTRSQALLAVFGRICLSIIFLFGACEKIMNPAGATAMMLAHGLPLAPLLLVFAVVIELLGALALLTGLMARSAALMLILYLIPVTAIMHNFWMVAPPEATIQLIMALKNLAIMGGLFMVAAFGAGPLIVESETLKLRQPSEHEELTKLSSSKPSQPKPSESEVEGVTKH